MRAGRDLTLQGQNRVQIRDTLTDPFLATSGRDLTIQGNQSVDILALNHLTQTPFVSGGNTTLLSNNPVSADAHFSSGGNFAVTTLEGRPNHVLSLFDPVITAGGDYAIGNYTGASLLVTAGGNISFGDVAITAIDPAINPNQPVFILNAGGNITGTGTIRPDAPNIYAPPVTNLLVSLTSGGTTNINQIITDGGDVNIQAQGEIRTGTINTSSISGMTPNAPSGSVILDAEGNIQTGNIKADADSSDPSASIIKLNSRNGSIFLNNVSFDTSNTNPDGVAGQIFIDAARNIDINDSYIYATGRLGGILLGATLAPAQINISNSILTTRSVNLDDDTGNISLQGAAIAINSSGLQTSADDGIAGDISIQASATNGPAITLINTTIDTAAFEALGQTGNTTLVAPNRGNIFLQGQGSNRLFADTYGSQASTTGISIFGGDIQIDNYILDSTVYSNARGSNITIDGRAIALTNGAAIRTDVKGDGGMAGTITVTGDALSLAGGSQISAKVDQGSTGLGGDINLNIRGLTDLSGTGTKIVNSVEERAIGDGGLTNIQTHSLLIRDNAAIESITSGLGNAGNLNITAQDGVFLENGNINSDVKKGATGDAGNIVITSDRFSMSSPGSANTNTRITGRVDAGSQGNGADIIINTRLATLDNSAISFSTSGAGNAGVLTINAQDLTLRANAGIVGDVGDGGNGRGGSISLNVAGTLRMDGAVSPGVNIASSGESTRITAGVGPGGRGQGGDVRIQAGAFVMENGAIIKNSTRGQGNAGTVQITAAQVDISGSVPQSGLPSGVFTSTGTDFRAGDILFNTGNFRISNGSALNAQSTGNGPGGNITVNAANQFEAFAGGQLITSTFGAGTAGNIQVNAPSVTIAGQDPHYQQRLAKFPNPVRPGVANAITETGPSSGLFANAIATPTTTQLGKGGDISIIAKNILIKDHAGLKVDSRSGNLNTDSINSAGTIKLQSNRLTLDNGAFINAETDSGSGGNILIAVRDLLLMRRNSEISTTAGSASKGGNGGNIEIMMPKGFLVTGLYENNDIIANAFGGRGGKITISAIQIIGFKQQSRLSPFQLQQIRQNGISDISASSDVGADGQVAVQTLGIDPSRGLAELEATVLDPADLISQACQAEDTAPAKPRNEFVITGRGGLPPSANTPQTGGGIAVPWVQQPETAQQLTHDQPIAEPQADSGPPEKAQPLIEAQGIAIAPDGTPILTAQAITPIPQHPAFLNGRCRDRGLNQRRH